ncbi:Protein kinase-like domain [Pseudocohnilembus persalinus]|uniref:Protein kinase-like domain n=1 Tax=Pseudocohnilembus persalinus TaxID=266149 RepID=A0A0V0R092_PSEPJ|nr:Protein kinase-like domain [Pseudocohnilembus persalinus]|eukprot:KRX07958.1 Protein kinase-like domain [Pseudocohnilembus persalinus]
MSETQQQKSLQIKKNREEIRKQTGMLLFGNLLEFGISSQIDKKQSSDNNQKNPNQQVINQDPKNFSKTQLIISNLSENKKDTKLSNEQFGLNNKQKNFNQMYQDINSKELGQGTESQVKVFLNNENKQKFAVKIIYCNDLELVHRDIKPENILINSQNINETKIIDFGVCSRFSQPHTYPQNQNQVKKLLTRTGTLPYKAPEIIQNECYDETIDIWALGVIIYEFATGKLPFYNEYQVDMIEQITQCDPDYNYDIFKKDTQLKDFLQRILKKNPKYRLKSKDALNHQWFFDLKKKYSKQIQITQDDYNAYEFRNTLNLLFKVNSSSNLQYKGINIEKKISSQQKSQKLEQFELQQGDNIFYSQSSLDLTIKYESQKQIKLIDKSIYQYQKDQNLLNDQQESTQQIQNEDTIINHNHNHNKNSIFDIDQESLISQLSKNKLTSIQSIEKYMSSKNISDKQQMSFLSRKSISSQLKMGDQYQNQQSQNDIEQYQNQQNQ